MTTTILAICTGNICRSPAIEALFRQRLDDSVTVRSAGTHAVTDASVDPTMGEALRRRGLDASGHNATQVTQAMVSTAALIVTAAREHRHAVLRIVPGAVRRTFTLRELAMLSQGVRPSGANDEHRLASLLITAPRRRPQMDPRAGLGIDDPYGRGADAHARALAEIDEAVTTIVEVLRHER